jgi:hypothetical protein
VTGVPSLRGAFGVLAIVAALIWHADTTSHQTIVRYKPGVCVNQAKLACVNP